MNFWQLIVYTTQYLGNPEYFPFPGLKMFPRRQASNFRRESRSWRSYFVFGREVRRKMIMSMLPQSCYTDLGHWCSGDEWSKFSNKGWRTSFEPWKAVTCISLSLSLSITEVPELTLLHCDLTISDPDSIGWYVCRAETMYFSKNRLWGSVLYFLFYLKTGILQMFITESRSCWRKILNCALADRPGKKSIKQV